MTGAWSLRMPGEDVRTFSDDTGMFMRRHPELQSYDINTQDMQLDGVDGEQFGRDTHSGATYAISFGVQARTELEVRDLEGELKRLWRGDSVRRSPDAVGELVSDRGRSSFGRPRQVATAAVRYHETPPSSDVNADWRAADALWYGAKRIESVGIVPVLTGGVSAPVSAPVTVGNGPATRATTFTVDTEVPTWLSLRIAGPIVNPSVRIIRSDGFALTYSFATTVAYDDALLFRSVPWARGTVRQSSGGTLSPATGSSRYDAAQLTSGEYELVLSGTAPTGSPRAYIEWADAHTTP